MPTKFTPITNGAPQSGGEIDNLISAIQSMRQMRKQMKDEEWKNYTKNWTMKQNERTAMMQGKADEADRLSAEYQNRITNMLANPQPQGGYKMADVDMLSTQGKMTKEQYAMLQQRASDYVPDSERRMRFASRLGEIKDVPMLEKVISETGIDPNDAYRMWNENQQLNKPTGGGKDGGGTGDGGAGTGTGKMTVGEAEGKNWKKQYRGAGRTQPNGISVRAYGNDASPTMVVHRDDGLQIEKKRDKYVAVYRENGKRIEVVLTVKGDELVGSLPGKNKIKPAIKKALDAAYVEWETKSIDAQGKITDYPFYGEK